MANIEIVKVNLYHLKAVFAVIARASSNDNIGKVLAQEHWVYWGLILGLQTGSM